MYEDLIRSIRGMSYPDTVDYLEDIVKDRKLRFLLSLGFGGELADVDLKRSIKYIKAKDLVPTQKDIDITRSLIWSLNGRKKLDNFFKSQVTVISPLVTFHGKYIIDGHHRWIQAYCTNPELKILCINYTGNISVTSMLKAVQATIGINIGALPRYDTEGISIYDMSEEDIRRFIERNLTKGSVREFMKFVELRDREEVVEYLVGNCMMLKKENKPIIGSQEREIMPQTGNNPKVLNDLDVGITKI